MQAWVRRVVAAVEVVHRRHDAAEGVGGESTGQQQYS